jgi:Putative Sin3 binding protein
MTSASHPVSTLAAALAHTSGNDILKPRDAGHLGHDTNSHNHSSGLPTPPNSLSPTIPPQKGSPTAIANTPLNIVDSDIELQDAPPSDGVADDATGDITPALLAKHHLPEILLSNGPLAIRYVLAHLTASVPGFARIPAAKARRIVVSALESRNGGGVNGDVVFEKVGWGRWDARARSSKTKYAKSTQRKVSPLSPGLDAHYASHEDEADNMSLDGEREVRKLSISIAPPLDDSDATDEEDWESIGPAGLMAPSYAASHASRRGSHSSSIGPRPSLLSRSTPHSAAIPMKAGRVRKASAGFKVDSKTARSMSYSGGILPFERVYSSSLSNEIRISAARAMRSPSAIPSHAVKSPSMGSPSLQAVGSPQSLASAGSPQEVEAIEALLRMGGGM